MKNRCVYMYVRNNGDSARPYYIGKGTIERAYDWMHHRVRPPVNPANIRIVARDMTDVDARQAEMLLIHFYGRKNRTFGGTLHNIGEGGEGPASDSPELQARAQEIDAAFWEQNASWSLILHEDGYWHSPTYPKVRMGNRHSRWIWVERENRKKEPKTRRKKWEPTKSENPRPVDDDVIDDSLRLRLAQLRYDAQRGDPRGRQKAFSEYQQLIAEHGLAA